MPVTKVVRSRGATVTVVAAGEVLFTPAGAVGSWKVRFSQRAREFAAQAAPTNKRPRWAHYGTPLKGTMRASTDFDPSHMKVHSAIGSTAPHGYYVDQGTSDFQAKILPPWFRGSASLYEHTWRPGPNAIPVGTIRVRGQKGQEFLAAGVARAFASMRMRSFQVPGDPKITGALSSFPEGLANFSGATPADGAFMGSLAEWRAWRDERFNSGRILGDRGQGGSRTTAEQQRRWDRSRTLREAAGRRRVGKRAANAERRKAMSAERSRKWREAQRNAKSMEKAPQARRNAALRAEKARFLAAVIKKYGVSNVEKSTLEFRNGAWHVTVKRMSVRPSDGAIRPEYVEVRGKSEVK